MPVNVAYAHNNYLQLRLGYDYRMTVTYSARSPFPVSETPWKWTKWTAESGPFLIEKRVGTVVFPYHEGSCGEWNGWIKSARAAVPGLVVLDKHGEEVF